MVKENVSRDWTRGTLNVHPGHDSGTSLEFCNVLENTNESHVNYYSFIGKREVTKKQIRSVADLLVSSIISLVSTATWCTYKVNIRVEMEWMRCL